MQRGATPPAFRSLDVNHALLPGRCTVLLAKVIKYPKTKFYFNITVFKNIMSVYI